MAVILHVRGLVRVLVLLIAGMDAQAVKVHVNCLVPTHVLELVKTNVTDYVVVDAERRVAIVANQIAPKPVNCHVLKNALLDVN